MISAEEAMVVAPDRVMALKCRCPQECKRWVTSSPRVDLQNV